MKRCLGAIQLAVFAVLSASTLAVRADDLRQPEPFAVHQVQHQEEELLPPPPTPFPESPAEEVPAPLEPHEGLILMEDEPLPPLEEELWLHGGSYLYAPEGDRLNWPSEECAHYDLLRLPECWTEPRPVTGHRQFLGADPIVINPAWHWFGCNPYVWEPRFVGHGSYSLFAIAREENDRRQDLVGHQLIVDLDLRLTGTERFHVQFRPIGPERTGGSYYQFTDPRGYVDNSRAEPDRYWFEAELHSLVGADFDPFAALDYNVTFGRVPLVFHNQLLLNDEMLAVVANKNTIIFDEVSNLNLQAVYGFGDVSIFNPQDPRLYAVHASVDHRRVFYEATYAFVEDRADRSRDTHYGAVSRTAFYGPYTLAARALFKHGDRGGLGSGELFVVETQKVRLFDHHPLGIEQGVFYCNAFLATEGWSSIAGANFNRLNVAFEVNPLIRLSAVPPGLRTWGVSSGVQLFRHHEDESWIPELAYEEQAGVPAIGLGLRWLRKLGPRTFLEVVGVATESDDAARDREGVAATYTVVF